MRSVLKAWNALDRLLLPPSRRSAPHRARLAHPLGVGTPDDADQRRARPLFARHPSSAIDSPARSRRLEDARWSKSRHLRRQGGPTTRSRPRSSAFNRAASSNRLKDSRPRRISSPAPCARLTLRFPEPRQDHHDRLLHGHEPLALADRPRERPLPPRLQSSGVFRHGLKDPPQPAYLFAIPSRAKITASVCSTATSRCPCPVNSESARSCRASICVSRSSSR